MSTPRYTTPEFQRLYEGMLVLAEDPNSELYWKGAQHRGASHRCAFWDGFSGRFDYTGPKRSAQVVPGTLSGVCFMAGREWARRVEKASASLRCLAKATHAPGPWVMQRVTEVVAPYFFVQREGADGQTEHLEYASDGCPMWWGEEQAHAAIASASAGMIPQEPAGRSTCSPRPSQ